MQVGTRARANTPAVEDEDEDAERLAEMHATRVSGVLDPAHGLPFLLIKSREGHVSDELEKRKGEEPEPGAADPDGDGDEDQEGTELSKRKFSDDQRRELADRGEALPDGSFPIPDRASLEDAIHAYGRAKDKAAAKAHIEKRARALGAEDLIPEKWEDGGKDLSKAAADLGAGPEQMSTEPVQTPEGDGDTEPAPPQTDQDGDGDDDRQAEVKVTPGASQEELEAAEAKATLEKGRVSRGSSAAIHGAMATLAAHHGCPACQAFQLALPGDGATGEEAPEVENETEMEKERSGEPHRGERRQDGVADEAHMAKSRSVTEEAGENETLALLRKSLVALDEVRSAQARFEDARKEDRETLEGTRELLKSVDERVKAIEETPVPGGPMLGGQSFSLLGAPGGQVPPNLELAVLEKTRDQTTDPMVKDELGRQIALARYKAQLSGSTQS